MQLRDYQTKAIDSLRYSFNTKKKKAPLLVMPTGAGKTVVFASISKALATQDKNVLILVHRKELIDQASNKLKNIEVDHGIIAANYKPKENNIQIASVQTLVRRLQAVSFTPNFIIIDEAHHAAAGSWDKILKHFANAFKIGCTATPIRLDGRGLGDYFDDLIKSDSIDYIFSHSVLEHIRLFELEETINQMYRILKKGGFVSHNINYKDHLDEGLNNLRFPTSLWESNLFANSGFLSLAADAFATLLYAAFTVSPGSRYPLDIVANEISSIHSGYSFPGVQLL